MYLAPLEDPGLRFLTRHVEIHASTVEKSLIGRDMQECREIVLEFLDGYLLWLNDSERGLFKQSFFVSTTYLPGSSRNTQHEFDIETDSPSDKKKRQKSFAYSTCRPNSPAEARRILEAYLVLWRSVFTICESAAHAPNRIAQLFDWEVMNNGPLCKLSRLLASPNLRAKDHTAESFLDGSIIDFKKYGIHATDADVAEFYQDGMKALETRKVNFDDLNECANFRITDSRCKPKVDGAALPRLKDWLRKTFEEPEGVKAGIVAIRNYYPIMYFNVYLTLAAWAWFDPLQITAETMALADGVASTIGFLLEIASRLAVYPCRKLCVPSLPIWTLLLSILAYLIGLGEIGLWFLGSQMKILPGATKLHPPAAPGSVSTPTTSPTVGIFEMPNLIYLGAFGASVVIRALHNLILFLRFPAMSPGHHKHRTKSCATLNRLFWKTLIFFVATAAILVPLYYWFVVPTLSRSAFWTFCDSPQLVAKLQCYIGIIGLWIPLLSVILIMDFISYAIMLAFYGAYIAIANRVGTQSEESSSVMAGFRTFSTLLRRWTLRGLSQSSPSIDSSSVAAEMDSSQSSTTATVSTSSEASTSTSKKSRSSSSSKRKSEKKSKEAQVTPTKMESVQARLRDHPFADANQYEEELATMRSLWYLIVDDLVDMDLISRDTAKNLYVALNWQVVPLGAKPKDIIHFFFSSLSSLSVTVLDSLPPNYLQKLPPLTQLIPSYGEAVIFDISYLCNRDKKPISNLEFLVLKYPKEWKYFFQRMKLAFGGSSSNATCFGTSQSSSGVGPKITSYNFPESEEELLLWYLQIGGGAAGAHNSMHPDVLEEVRLWASLRGQTLYKTIRGTLSYRMALAAIYESTKYGSHNVTLKSQVILAHQQYGDPSMLKQVASDILLVYKKLSCPNILGRNLYGDTPFDLVFDWSPRDLVAQQNFRKKLSQQENEEIIRRYTLKSIYTETEAICSHGEALKHLIDSKSTDCPIDPKLGFPLASILAGLPTATRIMGKTWLFKYRGNPSKELGPNDSLSAASSTNDYGAIGSDDEDAVEGSDSSSTQGIERRKKKRAETFKWDFLSCGSAVVHSSEALSGTSVEEDPPGWLRCFNADTGREFDFLLRKSSFDVLSVGFVKVPAKAIQAGRVNSTDMLQATSEESSAKSTIDPSHGSYRIYAVLKFGVRHPRNLDRHEVMAMVVCVNGDVVGDISNEEMDGYGYEEVTTPLTKMEAQKTTETTCLQRVLTRTSGMRGMSREVDAHKLSSQGQEILNSVFSMRGVLGEYASDQAFSQESATTPTSYNIFLGIEVKSVLPRRNTLILRVAGELPFGDGDRIQGKAANQMNGQRYAFGLVIQTKDANQGGNVAEALKFPIMLSKFDIHLVRDRHDQVKHLKKWFKRNDKNNTEALQIIQSLASKNHGLAKLDDSTTRTASSSRSRPLESDSLELDIMSRPSAFSGTFDDHDGPVELMERSIPLEDEYERDSKRVMQPPSIVGFRESVFTSGHGAVARFQAYAEWAFGTIVQRVLSKLGLRMHYGHPDFFASSWVYSRSAMSKANPVYNLSEDIFAGYVALLNNRRSIHTDKIQDEKGRDTSLPSTYTFTAKLAQGAASQMKSRDIFYLNSRLDFLRQFLLFHSSLGYYFTTTAMLSSVKMYLFGLLVFSLAGYSAENLGNLQFIYSVPFLIQVGMFTLLPLVLEVGVEEGVWNVLKVVIDLPFSLGYFLFQGQTTSHHLVESFSKGKSHYEATGRLLGLSRKSLVDMYQLYGRSHLEPALDYLFYVVVYYIVSSSRFGGYLPLFAPIICVVVFIIAPSGFQLGTPLKSLFNDVGSFGRWIYSTESFGALLKEWRSGPVREQMIKNLTWKATFKTTHTRLQTYSIFNNLKNVMSTHWRVDVATAVTQLARVLVWGFIVISIPGGMKDNVLKVLIGLTLYLMLAMAISSNTPHNKKGCWHSFSNLFFVVSLAYFIALFIILNAWRYLGDCAVGVFLSIKLLKSLTWCLFHTYALFSKMNTSRKWRSLERDLESKRISAEEKDRSTKELKASLEKHIIGGLFLVDTIDRPVLMISISAVLIPVHIVFNLLWAIPYLSDILMYSIMLRPKVNPDDISRIPPRWNGMTGGGFNAFASPDEIDELPSFDFEGDAEPYYM